ncbi:MAG TPA: AraC family transcriptional regulator [Candidatus Blautia ornithocaccae]|nr:AraC family transcriptional regulator [Candidatus Blautia ornithocaccae]
MNISVLMEYLSRQLHTILRRYDYKGRLIEQVCGRADFQDYIGEETEKFLSRTFQKNVCQAPVIAADSHNIAYAMVSGGEEGFLIGPVCLLGSTQYKHKLPEFLQVPKEWLASLHHCMPYSLLKEALFLHNLFHEEPLTLQNAFDFNCLDAQMRYNVQKNFTDIIFENQEYTSRHNPYDQEIRELSSITAGDTEQLSKSWEEDYEGRIGLLAKTPLRHCQNLGIVLVTLGARAAIKGGVIPEAAFSLSDSYINQIEEVKNAEAAISLGRQAEYQYAVLVKEIREQREAPLKAHTPNSKIGSCKDYIFSHLHEKLSASDVARAMLMSPSYLSDLFKKEEGITITEFILQEKIKLVKNMLAYSRYSYIEIANYLGFSSQSYLGAKFKKATGMTLHQYRERYGVKEFDTGKS